MPTRCDADARRSHAVENVDGVEVARFATLADTWWDRSGPLWPLHRLNELRVSYLREVLSRRFGRDPDIERPLAGLSVLDVGCGGGILSESIAALGASVLGIDVVEKNVTVAAHHAFESELPVSYEVATAAALAGRRSRFDVVLNMEVVEHVPQIPVFISDCARLVNPGGAMVLATINRTVVSWLFAIFGAEYVLRWLPRGTHRWSRFVTPKEAENLLTASGLRVEARTGVRVNPFTRRFSLTSTMAANYMLLGGRVANRGQKSAT